MRYVPASALAVLAVLLLCAALAVLPVPARAGDDSGYDLDFEIPEAEEPRGLGFKGEIELRATIRPLDEESLLYKQRYYQDMGDSVQSDFLLRLKPELSYALDAFSLYARPRLDLDWSADKRAGGEPDEPSEEFMDDERHWGSSVVLEEGFATWQLAHALTLEAGKKVLKWGKGYAWNPVAFVSRPKDIDDPDQTREGYVMAYADAIRSFDGPLTTLALTPVLVPVGTSVNGDLAPGDSVLYGAKAYFLLYDTDIDLLFMNGESFDTRLGLDFSTNLSSNFEAHGEAALRRGFDQQRIDDKGNLSSRSYDAFSYLLGLRYLSSTDTTLLLEYYHNDEGYSPEEMREYFTLIENGYNQYRDTGNDRLIKRSNLVAGDYNPSGAGRDYLYLRLSRPEPWDILYLTPALTCIANLGDASFTVNPEVSYLARQDLTLRALFVIPFGPAGSEFSEKVQDAKIQLSMTYTF